MQNHYLSDYSVRPKSEERCKMAVGRQPTVSPMPGAFAVVVGQPDPDSVVAIEAQYLQIRRTQKREIV